MNLKKQCIFIKTNISCFQHHMNIWYTKLCEILKATTVSWPSIRYMCVHLCSFIKDLFHNFLHHNEFINFWFIILPSRQYYQSFCKYMSMYNISIQKYWITLTLVKPTVDMHKTKLRLSGLFLCFRYEQLKVWKCHNKVIHLLRNKHKKWHKKM